MVKRVSFSNYHCGLVHPFEIVSNQVGTFTKSQLENSELNETLKCSVTLKMYYQILFNLEVLILICEHPGAKIY